MTEALLRQTARQALILLAVVCTSYLLSAITIPQQLHAQVDTFEFANAEQQRRFRRFSDELRCPMCQNTNLSGSTGGTAEDLRRELYRMITEGWTDSEIEQFMFERYGDFIFYRPRFRSDTLLLWFGPLIFLLVGGAAAFLIWRKAQNVPEVGQAGQLDDEQRRKLASLLDNNNS